MFTPFLLFIRKRAWGFFTFLAIPAYCAPCGATARCAALCALKPIWNGKPLEIERVYSKLIGTNLVPLPDWIVCCDVCLILNLAQFKPYKILVKWHSPNVATTPLRHWDFGQCLSFSWTTQRDKHCRHPIFVMGVVDTFRHMPPYSFMLIKQLNGQYLVRNFTVWRK